jgi:hypothetical protein
MAGSSALETWASRESSPRRETSLTAAASCHGSRSRHSRRRTSSWAGSPVGPPKPLSLLLGAYDTRGALLHVGRTLGIPPAEADALLRSLAQLACDGDTFAEWPRPGLSRWDSHRFDEWVPVRPALVCEVSFSRLDGHFLRHSARFKGRVQIRGPLGVFNRVAGALRLATGKAVAVVPNRDVARQTEHRLLICRGLKRDQDRARSTTLLNALATSSGRCSGSKGPPLSMKTNSAWG